MPANKLKGIFQKEDLLKTKARIEIAWRLEYLDIKVDLGFY
jgi:hypothetical protein